MIPCVMVRSKPKGLPITNTLAPTSKRDESPYGITVNLIFLGGSIFIMARSLAGSIPTTFAGKTDPSKIVTRKVFA